MNLDRMVLVRIDKLYNYREGVKTITVRAEDGFSRSLDILLKGLAFKVSGGNLGQPLGMTGKLPGFS